MSRKAGSKFFHFRQNNSGGDFTINENVDILVVIEAVDYIHANGLAETKGIYFHGVSRGIDCSCCGSRWTNQSSYEEGYDNEFCDDTLEEHEKKMGDNSPYEVHFVLHYLDGTVVRSRGRIENRNADGSLYRS